METTSLNSRRAPNQIEAEDLEHAKRIAEEEQAFLGTKLKLYSDKDCMILLSLKSPNEHWEDVDCL